MPKSKANGKKRNGIVNLKIVVEKLQKSLSLGRKSLSAAYNDDHQMDEMEEVNNDDVPDDVKEGHFAVMAVDDDYELKRFVVPLSCLTHPTFLRLLEQAAEEYGFDREGALTIPCRPSELERILAEQWIGGMNSRVEGGWNSRTRTMVTTSC